MNPLIRLPFQVPETKATVSCKYQPGKEETSGEEQKRTLRRFVGIADAKYEENNNKIYDVIEHKKLGSSPKELVG